MDGDGTAHKNLSLHVNDLVVLDVDYTWMNSFISLI